MLPPAAQAVSRTVPSPLRTVGFGLYTHVYVPLFAAEKRTYDLGAFRMKLDQSESSKMVSRRFRSYERDVSALIADALEPGGTYVDVGSNKGYHVLEAASVVGESGVVHSFEPNPENVVDLRENVRLNGFENVAVHELAVYDETSTSAFQPGPKSGWGAVCEEGELRVETTTFDRFLRERDLDPASVDVVKVDVEGTEASVLAGMRESLGAFEDCRVVVEVHPDADVQRMSRILHETDCAFEKDGEYWLIEP